MTNWYKPVYKIVYRLQDKTFVSRLSRLRFYHDRRVKKLLRWWKGDKGRRTRGVSSLRWYKMRYWFGLKFFYFSTRRRRKIRFYRQSNRYKVELDRKQGFLSFFRKFDDTKVRTWFKHYYSKSRQYKILNFLRIFETRLDVVCFRMKFLPTIFMANYFIKQKGFFINHNKIYNPSHKLQIGDLIHFEDNHLWNFFNTRFQQQLWKRWHRYSELNLQRKKLKILLFREFLKGRWNASFFENKVEEKNALNQLNYNWNFLLSKKNNKQLENTEKLNLKYQTSIINFENEIIQNSLGNYLIYFNIYSKNNFKNLSNNFLKLFLLLGNKKNIVKKKNNKNLNKLFKLLIVRFYRQKKYEQLYSLTNNYNSKLITLISFYNVFLNKTLKKNMLKLDIFSNFSINLHKYASFNQIINLIKSSNNKLNITNFLSFYIFIKNYLFKSKSVQNSTIFKNFWKYLFIKKIKNIQVFNSNLINENNSRFNHLLKTEQLNNQYLYKNTLKTNFNWKFKTLIASNTLQNIDNMKLINNWTKKILIFIKFAFQLKNFIQSLFINFLSNEKNLRWFFLRLWLHYRFFFVKFSSLFSYANNFLNYYSLLSWIGKSKNTLEKNSIGSLLKYSWFKSIYARLIVIRFQLLNFFKKNMNFSTSIFKNFIFLLKNLLLSWNFVTLNNKVLKSYNQINYLLVDNKFLNKISNEELKNYFIIIESLFKNNLGYYLYKKDNNILSLLNSFKKRYIVENNNFKQFKHLIWELNQFFFNYIKSYLKKIFIVEFCFNNSSIKFKTINNKSLNNFIFSFFLEQGFTYNLLSNSNINKNFIKKNENYLTLLSINNNNDFLYNSQVENLKYNSYLNFSKNFKNILIEDKVNKNTVSEVLSTKVKKNLFINLNLNYPYKSKSLNKAYLLNTYIRTKNKKIKQISFNKFKKNWLEWSIGKYNIIRKNYSYFMYSLFLKKYKNVKYFYKIFKLLKKKIILKNIKNDIQYLKEVQIFSKTENNINKYFSRKYLNTANLYNQKFSVNWNHNKTLNSFQYKLYENYLNKNINYRESLRNLTQGKTQLRFNLVKSMGILNNNKIHFLKKNFLNNHWFLSKILLSKSMNFKKKDIILYNKKKKKKKLLLSFFLEKNKWAKINSTKYSKSINKNMLLEIKGWQNSTISLNLKKSKRLKKFWNKFFKDINLEKNNNNIIKILFRKRFKRFLKRHIKYISNYYYLITQKKFLNYQMKNLNFYFGKKLKNNKFRSFNFMFKNLKINKKFRFGIYSNLLKPRKIHLKQIGDRMFLNILQYKYKKNINLLNNLKQKILKTIFFISSWKKQEKKNFLNFKRKYFWISRMLKKKIRWFKQYKRRNFLFKRISYSHKWKNINKKNISSLGEFFFNTYSNNNSFVNLYNTENLFNTQMINKYSINVYVQYYRKNLNKQKLYFDNLLKLEKYNIIKFKNIINLQYFNINSFNNNINNVKNKVLLKDSFIENFLRNNFLYRSLLKVNYEKKNFLYQKLLKNNTQENILDHFNKENNLKRNELKRYKKYFWYRQKWNRKSILKRVYNLRSYMLQLSKIQKYKKKKFSNIRNKPLLLLPQNFEYDFTLLQGLMISTPKVGTSVYGGADNNYFYSLINFYKRRGI